MKLDKTELKILLFCLKQFVNELYNSGCNDIYRSDFNYLSDEELNDFFVKLKKYVNDDNDYTDITDFSDVMVVNYFIDKIEKELEND